MVGPAGLEPATKGRFRSFLLASVRHFLSDARDRERAVKRGRGRAPIPLDGFRLNRAARLLVPRRALPSTLRTGNRRRL